MPSRHWSATTLATKIQREREQTFTPNVTRLVRSAMSDERYCSFILDCLHPEPQAGWSLRQLDNMWKRAAASELTVEQFIMTEKRR